MATINLGKVITDQQKAVLDKQSYDSVNSKLQINGDENVNGNFTADSIIENMAGYRFVKGEKENVVITYSYAGAVKNGNKLTFSIAGKFVLTGEVENGFFALGVLYFPQEIGNKLYPTTISGQNNVLATKQIALYKSITNFSSMNTLCSKTSNITIAVQAYPYGLDLNTEYNFRYEITFLLSDNLAV